MPKIRVLDNALAELIAAGEVVERPASIAKELIENAVDAGATAITVEIEGGGRSLLRICDNGCGIAREEIPTAFLRHATSKISTPEDLYGISTLGFRGEALASVAAMAKVELLTKTAGENEGTLFRIEGGQQLDIHPAGCPEGTAITVRDVFYNTPARMKFLKKDVGEGNAVAGVVDKCALAYPHVAFKFVRDGKLRLQTSGSGELIPVIHAIYGKDFAGAVLPVEHAMPQEGLHVKGYVTGPDWARPSRAYQNFFLNSRYVRTRTGAAALEEAFKSQIGSGKHPGCVLHIEIAPSLVDVNVHPAKIEVRFANERPVFQCVYFAVKSALSPGSEKPAPRQNEAPPKAAPPLDAAPQGRMSAQQFRALYTPKSSWGQENFFNKAIPLHSPTAEEDIALSLKESGRVRSSDELTIAPDCDEIFTANRDTINRQNAATLPENPTNITSAAQPESLPLNEARVIGELSGVYILLELGGNLVVVDKHAAHERILYERLKKELSYGNRQLLLTPLTLTFAHEEHEALTQNPKQLEDLGFLLEDFGGNTLLVREIPIEMGERDITFLLADIAQKLRKGRADLTPDAMDKLYYSIACKGALRAKDQNCLPELKAVVQMLWDNPQITRCPHGRPVQISLSAYEIEKMFGRQG